TLVSRAAAALGWASLALIPVLMILVAVLARRIRGPATAPLAWILGATVVLLAVDLATGARLQLGGILGYAPHGRFYGLGNAGFAVLGSFALTAAALHVHHAPRRREALASAAAFLAFVVVIDGAPGLGGDVGGLLTLVPVFALTWMAMAGVRLTWRRLAGVAGIAMLGLATATAFDLLRPPGSRTHLGRLAADTWHAGPGHLLTVLGRRIDINLGLLVRVPWSWLVLAVVAGVVYALVVRRMGADLLPPGGPLRAGVLGTLAVGVVGFVLNDSGVIVTALALLAVGPLLATLALNPPAPAPLPPALLEPASDPGRRARTTT
ncbi:MAG: hypothetical protein ACRD12_09015, partial [Acidimicrobiales bacterium]